MTTTIEYDDEHNGYDDEHNDYDAYYYKKGSKSANTKVW